MTLPRLLLHLEGAGLLAVAVGAYFGLHGNGWLFLALLLAPDLFMLGYLINVRVGAAAYNAGHTTLLPLLLGSTGVLTHHQSALWVALIWLAHIGMDRMLGYGLKYETGFKDTHLQRV